MDTLLSRRTKAVITLITLTVGSIVCMPGAQAQTNQFVNTPRAARSYRDPASGTIFYVESDLHHVVALDKDGKILWCRQPALDGNLPPYSEKHPRANPAVVWIGALAESQNERLKNTGGGKFIGISFNSRQAGVLDTKTGDFTFWGQN